jgi:phage shock protein PspC (stress-responsive transcriptional regulator)
MNSSAPQPEAGATPADASSTPAASYSGTRPGTLALSRPAHDRMLAGVASGAAHYLGVDVTLVRIALVVLCFVGGIGLPLYLAGWLLIPEEGAYQSIAAEFLRGIQGGRN